MHDSSVTSRVGYALMVSPMARSIRDGMLYTISIPLDILLRSGCDGTTGGMIEVGVDERRQRLGLRADTRQGIARSWHRMRTFGRFRVRPKDLPWVQVPVGCRWYARRWWVEDDWVVFDMRGAIDEPVVRRTRGSAER